MEKLILSNVEDLLKVKEDLTKAKGIFGEAIKNGLKKNQFTKVVKMIDEQLQQGNSMSIEWCIGFSTLQLMKKLNLVKDYPNN